jgi:hypothetical protein
MEYRPKRFSRRFFLGGAGVAISLPFLPSLSRHAGAQAGGECAPPKRIIAYYVANGMHMQDWTPTATGAGYTLPHILEPLADFKQKLLVLTGLRNEKQEAGPGDHAGGTGSFLTCKIVRKASVSVGISMDQVIAGAIGKCTNLPSLELGMEGGGSTGSCDSGYSCAYQRNISWANESTPMPKITNPQLAFDRLFAGFDTNATAAEVQRRLALRKSALDYTREQANDLKKRLSAQDNRKVDEYLTGVRELEIRIQNMSTGPTCVVPARPANPSDITQRIDLMHQLMATAFQCDATRVITFMMANSGSGRSHDFLGVSGGHHDISHHQSNPENFEKLKVIDRWEMQRFAHLLGLLEGMKEADGTSILDNSAVFLSSEISDGDRHNHDNLPVLLAGRLRGTINSGRHVKYTGGPPLANLFITLFQQFGVQATTFGDKGTAPLPDVTV